MTTERLTYYLAEEGRPSMEACIRHAADWCLIDEIGTMVIFTGTGLGPHYAAKEILVEESRKHLRVVAVTPPFGRPYRSDPKDPKSPLIRAGIKEAMRDELAALGIPTVSAHLPFKEMYDGKTRSSEWSRVAEAFGILGGGFALCVQATLIACDAGFIDHGERVVAISADTAIAVTACRTESFLSPIEGMLVGHIICRPRRYNISKQLHETIAPRDASEAIETTGREIGPAPTPQLVAAVVSKTSKKGPRQKTVARTRKTRRKP
jgi:hypothetical protein